MGSVPPAPNLLFQVISGILGLPQAAPQTGIVQQRAIRLGVGPALALEGVFRDEFPIELAGAVFQQFVEGGTDGGFVCDAELGEFGQAVVINDNLLVRGLEVEARHGGRLEKRGEAVNVGDKHYFTSANVLDWN